jgi:hypothetical protein
MAKVQPALVDVFRKLVSGRAPWPLYLHGAVGGGKTCAALALADFIDTAVYFTAEDLADQQMRDGIDWEIVRTKGLAMLDELGERERVGDLHYSVVKKFCDAREVYAGRVAIYIGNLKPSELATLYDDRICSRVLAGTRFELVGDDRRATR